MIYKLTDISGASEVLPKKKSPPNGHNDMFNECLSSLDGIGVEIDVEEIAKTIRLLRNKKISGSIELGQSISNNKNILKLVRI